jgi:hypothetical protein
MWNASAEASIGPRLLDTARHHPDRDQRKDVYGEGRVDVLEQPFLDHVPRAVMPFLARLKHELHGSGELIATRIEQACGSGEHGHVSVVAAGVHRPLDCRLELEVRVLGHRQRVHIAAQQQRRSRRGAPQRRDDAARRRALRHLEVETAQRVEHRPLGLGQLQTELGVHVQVSPQRHGVGHEGGGLLHEHFARESHLVRPLSGDHSTRSERRLARPLAEPDAADQIEEASDQAALATLGHSASYHVTAAPARLAPRGARPQSVSASIAVHTSSSTRDALAATGQPA